MRKAGVTWMKNLHYLVLVSVIALGLITIVGSGGGGGGKTASVSEDGDGGDDGDTGETTTVAENGEYPAVALDSNGFPHISYEARGAGSLEYASWDGSTFDAETVATMPLVNWEDRLTPIAIDT